MQMDETVLDEEIFRNQLDKYQSPNQNRVAQVWNAIRYDPVIHPCESSVAALVALAHQRHECMCPPVAPPSTAKQCCAHRAGACDINIGDCSAFVLHESVMTLWC